MTTFHPLTPKKCSPPRDSRTANGTFWRFVFNNPPVSEDFVIWILEPENIHKLEERQDCRAFAISMLTEEGVERKLNLFIRGMTKKAEKRGTSFLGLAQVRLNKDTGMLKQTGRDHHYDLWPYVTCNLENQVIQIRGI